MSIADFAPAETGAAVLAHLNEVVDSANAADAHAIAADPHTQYQKESEKGAASGYAPLDAGQLVPVVNLPAATEAAKGAVELATSAETTAGLAVQASDTRLSDPRTPTGHKTSHQDGGADELSVTGLSGLLADGQTPLAHAASHASGAADAITPAAILAVKGPGAVTDGRLMAFDGPTGYLARQTSLLATDLALLASANAFTARNTIAAITIPDAAGADLLFGADTKLSRRAANTLTLGGPDVAAAFLNLSRTSAAAIADLSIGVGSVNSPTYTIAHGGTLTGEKAGLATSANPLLVSAIPNASGFYWDKVTKAAGSTYTSADVTNHMSLVAGKLSLPVVGSGAGLLLGGDVALYRQAADVLGTADTIYQTAATCRRSLGIGWQEYIADYLKPTYVASASALYGIYIDGTLVESNNYWRGLSSRVSVPAGKTLSEAYGFYCYDPVGDGTVTNNYGFYVPNLAKGTNNYGVYFAGTGVGNCINWGGTVNLYSPSANVLRTDDAFQAASYAVGTTAGIDATVALFKLNAGGTNGSMTITKGIVTAYTAPT